MRSVLCAFLMVIVFVAAALPANAAAQYDALVFDSVNFLTSDEKRDIIEHMEQTAEIAQCNLMIIISDSTAGKTEREYTESMLDSTFGSRSDSVVLFLAANLNADHNDWVAASGKCEKTIGKNTDKLLTKVYEELNKGGWHGAGLGFCAGVEELITGETQIEESKYEACLSDLEGVLFSLEKSSLLELMQQTADKIQCSVGVVITDNLLGKSDSQYADDFLNDSFGFGANAVVLLLNNDKSNMNYGDWISTCGRGQDLYNSCTDAIFDEIYALMGENDYNGAIKGFCESLQKYSNGYSSSNFTAYKPVSEEMSISISTIVTATVVSFLITFVIVKAFTSVYKQKKPVSAAVYLETGRTNINHRVDHFIREYTTKTTSSSGGRSGGHHSGGGGHHSSSHSSHGGGGGRRR